MSTLPELCQLSVKRYAQPMSDKRDKTGTWLGIPFDWRKPTVARTRERWWNPNDRRLFTPKTFGWGYDINLYEAARRLKLRS